MEHIFHLHNLYYHYSFLSQDAKLIFVFQSAFFSLQGRLGFGKKHTSSSKKSIDGGGKVSWSVTSKDTGITLKSDDGKGKAVFEVPSGASDTIVTATISDPASGKSYYTDCLIDVK